MHSHHAATRESGAISELKDCDRIVVLVGAPNAGKSVLFNTLTGRSSTVANWPGVTVDLHIGRLEADGKRICIVDAPGAYGLVPTSPEENVTLEALLKLKPDVIIALLDSTNPEGSLNLIVQLIEMAPHKTIIALTKHALSHTLGIHIDVEQLSKALGVPIVVTSALEGEGLNLLYDYITGESGWSSKPLLIDYGLLEDEIGRLASNPGVREVAARFDVSPRWIAVQLLNRNEALAYIIEEFGYNDVLEEAGRIYESAEKKVSLQPELYLAERRLKFVEDLASSVIVKRKPAGGYWQKLADVLLHPLYGPIASFLGLFATFGAVFSLNTGFPLNMIFRYMGWEGAARALEEYNLSSLLESLFARLSGVVGEHLSQPWAGLIGDGIIGGVGFVLSFLPLVMLVYLSLGILEDSGIATRMAISFHPLFYRFGLSGRSVFPLLLGMGCNVPAEYATRGLPEDERFRAAFAVPFIPCQARLAVIIAITSVLIHSVLIQTIAVSIVYVEALIAALMTAWIASRFIQKRIYMKKRIPYEAKPELIMELPPVHRPHWKVIWWYVRDNTAHFIKKAGTIIFLLAIVTWGLLSYGPTGYTEDPALSYGGIIGERVGDLMRLIGVGEDRDQVLGLALVDGLIAKEGVLTAIAITLGYSEETSQVAVEKLGLSVPQAVGFLVMITLYFPCIATLAAMRSIVKSWRLVALYAIYSILIAILFATITYHVVEMLV